MKLLIIDDEPHIRQMMRLTLEAAGYQVDEAANGEDGLALFRNGEEHDAILLDQKMPGMDGLQTLKRMKERLPEASVIMVTAFASIDLAVDAMRLGATDFLRKPMTPEALRGAVAAALASHPRPPLRRPSTPADRSTPQIERLTLNGFRVVGSGEPADLAKSEHVFRVSRAGAAVATVIVAIDPEAVARVERLSQRPLQPGGAFWRRQAELRLSAFLWSEGKVPESGRLIVDDVAREDIDVAAAWQAD